MINRVRYISTETLINPIALIIKFKNFPN